MRDDTHESQFSPQLDVVGWEDVATNFGAYITAIRAPPLYPDGRLGSHQTQANIAAKVQLTLNHCKHSGIFKVPELMSTTATTTTSPAKSKKEKDKERPEKAAPHPSERLKTVVRRLPPNLPEEVFWQTVQKWVSDETATWKSYYSGKFKKRCVRSRVVLLLRTEPIIG